MYLKYQNVILIETKILSKLKSDILCYFWLTYVFKECYVLFYVSRGCVGRYDYKLVGNKDEGTNLKTGVKKTKPAKFFKK